MKRSSKNERIDERNEMSTVAQRNPGQSGEVSEWLKEAVLKTAIRETVSWVRIPPSPLCPGKTVFDVTTFASISLYL